MSQISLLSDQYEQLASASDKVNNSVITLKKLDLLKEGSSHPGLTVSKEEEKESSSILIPFLQSISDAIGGQTNESNFLPSQIFEDYKQRLSTNQFLQEDINELIELLKSEKVIESRSIAVLDELLAILDIERSTLFRKLRKARG